MRTTKTLVRVRSHSWILTRKAQAAEFLKAAIRFKNLPSLNCGAGGYPPRTKNSYCMDSRIFSMVSSP